MDSTQRNLAYANNASKACTATLVLNQSYILKNRRPQSANRHTRKKKKRMPEIDNTYLMLV